MKSPGERGPDGLWLYETRKRRGYTNAEAARAAIEHATGLHIAESVYAQYEAGTRAISAKHRPTLVAFWGEPPTEQPPAPASDIAALVAAIDRLTSALERSEATNAEVLRTLVAVVAVPAGTPTGPAVPSETASPAPRR